MSSLSEDSRVIVKKSFTLELKKLQSWKYCEILLERLECVLVRENAQPDE